MKYCSNCGTMSPDDAKFCVECGAKFMVKGQPPVTASPSQQKASTSDAEIQRLKRENARLKQKEKDEEDTKTGARWLKAIFWIVLIILFIKGCGGSGGSSVSSTRSTRASEHFLTNAEAFTCAEEIVKANLKSPSTAKFCKITEATIKYMGDGRYKVTGYVDAQNGYGATVRGDFVVHFTEVYDGKDIGYKEGTCYIENR